jgi:antitoxin (DNA-binding transcriptional repressor) of toxin-antitoxin stability system
MTTYSVAEAKAGLPSLINRALAGEEVIIARHGKPMVELRPARIAPPTPSLGAAHERLLSGRVRLPAGAPTSVELLNMIHEDSAL